MSVQTIAHQWLVFDQRSPLRPAAQYARSSGWKEIGWADYQLEVEKVAAGFLALGIKRGDRIALMSNTRFEWGCTDLACIAIGAVVVPIYQNNRPQDVEFVLNNSEAKILVSENPKTLNIWRKISGSCPTVKNVICFETDRPGDPALINWERLIHMGEEYLRNNPKAVKDLALASNIEDDATIIYTSGTTGQPKGVLLTHRQIVSEIMDTFYSCGVTAEDNSLAMLPMAHIMGRIELWGHAWMGYTIGYAESIERVRENLKQLRPTIMISVPRIFEKIYGTIQARIEESDLRKGIFAWAQDVSKELVDRQRSSQKIPIALVLKKQLADKLVFEKVRTAFGGRLRFAISGGAPLNPQIGRFFESCGILVLEGYGLSETTAAISLNTPSHYRFGTSGRPLKDAQIKIAPDGEILVKSDKVMKEYYKNPEATAAVMHDGYFATGDIGEFDEAGYLRITDRKKDLIKTAGGKYVPPQKIEGMLQLIPLIGQTVVVGDKRKYITALIALDRVELERIAKASQWNYTHWKELLDRTDVKERVREIVANANTELSSWETIKRYAILPDELTVENGDLTTSMKVKRKHLTEKYKDLIETLYEG